jgi:hypothetical protein
LKLLFASQQRYTDACFVAHLRHCSASVNPLPPDPGQWENDIDVIRIKGFADVQNDFRFCYKKIDSLRERSSDTTAASAKKSGS